MATGAGGVDRWLVMVVFLPSGEGACGPRQQVNGWSLRSSALTAGQKTCCCLAAAPATGRRRAGLWRNFLLSGKPDLFVWHQREISSLVWHPIQPMRSAIRHASCAAECTS